MLNLHMTTATFGLGALAIFVLAYLLVMTEEFLLLRKSKPVILAAGLIWILVAMAAKASGVEQATEALKHNVLEYAELFLFLLVAMTYVNAMEERQVFSALKGWLVQRHFSYRKLFWVTGILAFFLSPFADNMTTALVMCAIIMAMGKDKPEYVALSCINIVVAANAGGAYSPFGDITTLMVWQKGILPFHDFFKLFFPAVVNFVIPATIMNFAVPKGTPTAADFDIPIQPGGLLTVVLFILTIFMTVCLHHLLGLPPVLGMMTGLSFLQILNYFLKQKDYPLVDPHDGSEIGEFDFFHHIKRVEWDTLLFFYGIILCVGGLATFGYLQAASSVMYEQWATHLPPLHAQTPANIIIGLLSAIVDNIPLMFAVLTMKPAMSEGQWLLITLTTGVGGSLLSIGSAAGVALMGQTKGHYTFLGHLKWTWAILLGYLGAIATHIWLNYNLFFTARV